jgi:hypothetical protein
VPKALFGRRDVLPCLPRDRDRADLRLLGRRRRAHHLRVDAGGDECDLRRHRQAGAQSAAEECEAGVAARVWRFSSAGAPGSRGARVSTARAGRTGLASGKPRTSIRIPQRSYRDPAGAAALDELLNGT